MNLGKNIIDKVTFHQKISKYLNTLQKKKNVAFGRKIFPAKSNIIKTSISFLLSFGPFAIYLSRKSSRNINIGIRAYR